MRDRETERNRKTETEIERQKETETEKQEIERQRQIQRETWPSVGYETSNPTPSDTIHSTRLCLPILPKEFYLLRTKYSNT